MRLRVERLDSVTKPPYEIPSLADILSNEGSNGLVAASSFSGCGGSGLGLRWAGWRVPFASEFIPAAQETYRANFPTTRLSTGDIRDLAASEVIEACGRAPDLWEGSPPCSAFSMSGKRTEGWGAVKAYSDTKQRVDDLFWVWLGLAEELRPRALLAENVPALTQGKSAGAWKRLVKSFRDIGYDPAGAILDASRLGVPQARKRLIIVAFREDQVEEREAFSWPTPTPYVYTLRDALPGLRGRGGDEPPLTVDPETGQNIDITRYAIGREWAKLTPGVKARYLNLIRDLPSRPVSTVTGMGGHVGAASVTHPREPRKFTLAELRRLCGFPDDFELTGTFEQRWERLGRSVMPPVYRAVGERLAEALNSTKEEK